MQDEKFIHVYDQNGNEKTMKILFIGKSEKLNKEFIFYLDPFANDGKVYASYYDIDDTMKDVLDEDWDEVNAMFKQYIEDHKCDKCNSKEDCDSCDK